MDQCIIHMRQDAFLPVERVGLASCARSPKCTFARKKHDSLHLGVAPVDGVSCVYCMFCNSRMHL